MGAHRWLRPGSLDDFNRIVASMGRETLRYDFGSTPRTRLSKDIYTSTEYPADQEIPMHNEMSYTNSWPGRIWFYCEQPADTGGETPIADSRRVYEQIPPHIREAFEQHGVQYVRNYYTSIDVPWQQVFQTDDPAEVNAYCARNGIAATWEGEQLQTSQTCQASLVYNEKGDKVWFNQAHLFHYSSLPPALQAHLLQMFGEKGMPRNSCLGNNAPIPADHLQTIRDVYNQLKVSHRMKQHDILLLNNIITAHGRQPYTGARKIRVAMTR